jgi:hypothetical protein
VIPLPTIHPAIAFVIGLLVGAILCWLVADGEEDLDL